MDPVLTGQPTVLSPQAITRLPVEALGTLRGVSHRVLWRDETSMAGVLTVQAGHRLGTHSHRLNHHHIWVLDGRAKILGTELGTGSYVHIPSGVDHDIDATASDGCTVYYLYLRPSGSPSGVEGK
jgi:quercetin dioxygenase-like cupin family protein